MTAQLRSLYAESHDGVDNIIVILPQGGDGLLAGNACLSHDQLDILRLETRLIDLLTILLLLLLGLDLGGLALAVVVVVVMVVTGVLTGSLGSSQLLGGGSLSLGVQVLNLGLTEDAKQEGQYLISKSMKLEV